MPSRAEHRRIDRATFRAANDAIARNIEKATGAQAELLMLMCECASAECLEEIDLTPAEYAAVRRQGNRFAVARGHEGSDDAVLDEFDRFTLVEKARARRRAVHRAGRPS